MEEDREEGGVVGEPEERRFFDRFRFSFSLEEEWSPRPVRGEEEIETREREEADPGI